MIRHRRKKARQVRELISTQPSSFKTLHTNTGIPLPELGEIVLQGAEKGEFKFDYITYTWRKA